MKEATVRRVSPAPSLSGLIHHAPAAAGATSAASKPPPVELLSARQVAALLGVSERTFHKLRHEPWWTALPIALGERSLRWRRCEVEAVIATNAPRQAAQPAPAQLLAARSRGHQAKP